MNERVTCLRLRVGDRSLTEALASGLNNIAEYQTLLGVPGRGAGWPPDWELHCSAVGLGKMCLGRMASLI